MKPILVHPHLLVCATVQCVTSVPTFRKKLFLPSAVYRDVSDSMSSEVSVYSNALYEIPGERFIHIQCSKNPKILMYECENLEVIVPNTQILMECNIKKCWCLTALKTSFNCVGVQIHIPAFALRVLKQHKSQITKHDQYFRGSNQIPISYYASFRRWCVCILELINYICP